MTSLKSLKSYEDWKHCITVLCRIPLTLPYIEERLAAMRDTSDYRTQKFVQTWGEQHRLCVIGWFEQAQEEQAGADTGLASSGSES